MRFGDALDYSAMIPVIEADELQPQLLVATYPHVDRAGQSKIRRVLRASNVSQPHRQKQRLNSIADSPIFGGLENG